MEKELIEKANEIIGLIEKNEKAIEELSKYAESGGTLWFQRMDDGMFYPFYNRIDFEDWEIRLMIHQKKQRINALKVQLERL